MRDADGLEDDWKVGMYMKPEIRRQVEEYAQGVQEEERALLRTLGRIPAPSHQEGRRAAFCRDWLEAQGAKAVTIDRAQNVLCRLGPQDGDLVVFQAHTDIVFPDTDSLPLREAEGKLYAPGIGDDTANLVNLLMAAKFLLQKNPPLECGFLLAANSCEEGLGNLEGTKAIFEAYGQRIRAFYSFDCDIPACCNRAVGSYRYRISCRTAGGHSYADFGAPNALVLLCRLVDALYRQHLPTRAKTTYNVGRLEGGTTVNAIAQEASLLYEFRSDSQDCLEEMEGQFRRILASFQGQGGELTAELLGVRPGNGPVDEKALSAFTHRTAEVIRTFCGEEPAIHAASTDANIPLSLGILANTVGTVRGSGAHTREEWVELDSLSTGLKIVLGLMLQYAKDDEWKEPPT